jgi:hypothetical protein
MERKCNFDVRGKCYAPRCFSDIHCGAKIDNGDNGFILYATDIEVRERSAEVYGGVEPEIAVMQPRVVNSSENVATKGIVSYVVNEEDLCRKPGNWYKICPDYNSPFCRSRCIHGPREIDKKDEIEEFDSELGVILQKIDSFDFDNREDGK